MAPDEAASERLQPSLLDRLTDHDPGNPAESRASRVIDIERLRQIVRRDLSWLLNANNLETVIDAERYPRVARSTLNYGVRDASGDFANADRARTMQDAIRRAIEIFEPRVNAAALQVVVRDTEQGANDHRIYFDIRGELWAEPLPVELYLRSEVDLTTGEVLLEDAG